MKRLRFSMVLIVAVVGAIAFGGATAFASSGAATPFKAMYPVSDATTWTCSGAHVVNKATLPGSKDSETCIASGDLTGYQAGTYSSDPSLGTEPPPPGSGCVGDAALGYQPPYGIQGWVSDYFLNLGRCVVADSWTLTEFPNPDGTFTLELLAHYPI